MSNQGERFYGKYRGIVADNSDPLMLGRVKARVPDIYGEEESGWALPSLPYAGNGVGLFLIPPTDASVWIEFEHGDPDYPIWTGCFWAQGEAPALPAVAEIKVLKTDSGSITIDDTPGAEGITIETASGNITIETSSGNVTIDTSSGGITIGTTGGMKVEISSSGIEINNGQGGTVKLSGPKVSINDTALEVT
jgi:uncharacterized protein involved in type VI secretion and phage assembly